MHSPDPATFVRRGSRPIRILAKWYVREPTLESPVNRERIGDIDMIVGAGDLEPEYLSFVADAFHAPLRYVRGNHDVGAAWTATGRALLPEPMEDGVVVTEAGINLIGFSGSPIYSDRGMQVSSLGMWAKVLRSWGGASRARPVLVVTHAAPRGMNDDEDTAHRGFTAFRWLVGRLSPPLWLHGHTALVRRGIDDRCERHGETLLYNCTGATLVELEPPGASASWS